MPSISQQDYIYINVPVIEGGVESELSAEVVKQLVKCVRNGSIYDVILRAVNSATTVTSRPIFAEANPSFVNIAFYNIADDGIVTWSFDDPDYENNEEA